jgi:hypothetical protein
VLARLPLLARFTFDAACATQEDAEARADGAHVDPLRHMRAVGAKVGLALGVGDRLLQTAADAVGDFAHVLVLA